MKIHGEDTFEQIQSLNYTDKDKAQLNKAFNDENVSDEDFFELAFRLAEANGLNP